MTINPNLPPTIHTLNHPTPIPNPPPLPPTPIITMYQQTLPHTPCHHNTRLPDRAASSRPHIHGPPLRHPPHFNHGNNPGLYGCQINMQMHQSPRWHHRTITPHTPRPHMHPMPQNCPTNNPRCISCSTHNPHQPDQAAPCDKCILTNK